MTAPSPQATGCPVRKLEPEGRRDGPPLELVADGGAERWVVRSFDLARQVLREPDGTAQAGFGAEGVLAKARDDRGAERRAGR